jgi:hypothetical protein
LPNLSNLLKNTRELKLLLENNLKNTLINMNLPLMKTHLTLLRENNGLTLVQLVDLVEKLVLLNIE